MLRSFPILCATVSPKNSLIVLSRLGEAGILDDGSTDGIVAEAFIQIDENK